MEGCQHLSMVATQLLRFHGELPSLQFEGWRSRVASATTRHGSPLDSAAPDDPSQAPAAASQHLIVSRSRPLSSICPSPVHARLSRHVSGLWRWSLYRLIRSEEQPTQQEPQYDPHGMRASSGLTLEAEARIRELKRVLNLPEDRPPVLANYDTEGPERGEQDWEHVSDHDIESILEVDLENVLERVTERYLGGPLEESRIVELEGDLENNSSPDSGEAAKTPPTRQVTPKPDPKTPKPTPRTLCTQDHTPTTPSSTRDNVPRTHAPKTPQSVPPQRVSPHPVSQSLAHRTSPTQEPVSALGMTPMNIPKTPLKESSAMRVSSPAQLSPLSGMRRTTSPGGTQASTPSTPPSQLRDSLKSTPVKTVATPVSAYKAPVRSVPSTPHKSLPSPPSSPLGQEPQGPSASPSTPKQQPQPLPMSPGREVLSPGNPLTPGTNTGTDATPLSPRTPLSPPVAFHNHQLSRSESHSELLEHVERFKSGSIRTLEGVQAGLNGQPEQTSEQQESELARVFKRIRGRRAVIT